MRTAAGFLALGPRFEPKVVSMRFVEDKVTPEHDFLPALLLFRANNHVRGVPVYSFTSRGTDNGTSRGRGCSKMLKVFSTRE